MLVNQWVIPGGVVRYPVKNYLHAKLMGCIYKVAEILLGTEFRVDAKVVFHRVGAAECAFTVFLTNGVNRH